VVVVVVLLTYLPTYLLTYLPTSLLVVFLGFVAFRVYFPRICGLFFFAAKFYSHDTTYNAIDARTTVTVQVVRQSGYQGMRESAAANSNNNAEQQRKEQ
jgi:hypothetical protein